MSSLRESTACKFFANESVVVPLPLPHTKQSLRSFVLELERRQIRRKEVGVEGVMELVRRRAPERKMIYAKICSLPYNKIKKQSNMISAKKVIAKCTYPINTAILHPFLPISTTAVIAPRVLPDEIFTAIYRRHPDRDTYLSIPM